MRECTCAGDHYPKAIDVMTQSVDETHTLCALCGRMYTARPLICLCNSNTFLRPVNPPPPITLAEVRELGWTVARAPYAVSCKRCPQRGHPPAAFVYRCYRPSSPHHYLYYCPNCGPWSPRRDFEAASQERKELEV
jgi:hypothetical protein